MTALCACYQLRGILDFFVYYRAVSEFALIDSLRYCLRFLGDKTGHGLEFVSKCQLRSLRGVEINCDADYSQILVDAH